MEPLTGIGVLLVLAFLVESMTEYFLGKMPVQVPEEWRQLLLMYVAALVGVGLAMYYGLDALQQFLGLSPVPRIVGQVLTGLIIGRGANFVHDFYTKVSA